MKTIRGRILLSFLSVSLIVLFVIGYVSYSVSKNALLNAASNEGRALAEKLRDSFQQYISARAEFLEITAGHEEMRSGDWERIRGFLSSLDARELDLQTFFFIQPDGDALYLDGQINKLGDRAYFKEAMATGKTIIGDPLLSRATNEMVIIVASPVKGSDGKPRGVLCGRIVANSLVKIIEAQKWGKEGYAFAVDYSGILVAHPNQEFIGVENALEENEKFAPGVSRGLRRAREGETSTANFVKDGETTLMAFSRVPRTGWLVALIAPEKDFLDGIYLIRNIIAALSAAALFLMLGVSLLIARSISSLVSKVIEKMNSLAEGDFSTPLDLKGLDEARILSEAVCTMIRGIRTLLDNTIKLSASVLEGMHKLNEDTKTMDNIGKSMLVAFDSVSQTSNALSETGDSIEEIATAAESGARAASNAGENTVAVVAEAEDGSRELKGILLSVQKVFTAEKTVGETIRELHSSVAQIAGFVNTITSIADQTNLLALNAAIEAARAGDAGRGFAVVADEVRKLAEESSGAAEDIGAVISSIVEKTDMAVKESGHSLTEVSTLEEAATKTEKKIEGIADRMEAVSNDVQSIAALMEEQSASIHEMTAVMEKLSRSGIESARRMEEGMELLSESSRLASEFNHMSQGLLEGVEELKDSLALFKI